jgi:hypothetical protein
VASSAGEFQIVFLAVRILPMHIVAAALHNPTDAATARTTIGDAVATSRLCECLTCVWEPSYRCHRFTILRAAANPSTRYLGTTQRLDSAISGKEKAKRVLMALHPRALEVCQLQHATLPGILAGKCVFRAGGWSSVTIAADDPVSRSPPSNTIV